MHRNLCLEGEVPKLTLKIQLHFSVKCAYSDFWGKVINLQDSLHSAQNVITCCYCFLRPILLLPSWFLKLASEFPTVHQQLFIEWFLKKNSYKITRLSPFTKKKHFFLKSVHPSYHLCRNMKWIVLFIQKNRHNSFFSTFIQFWKPWSPKMFYLLL